MHSQLAAAAVGETWQVAPEGQTPPQTPLLSAPQGLAHRSAGPAQQVGFPAPSAQTQPCSQMPLTHRSTVQGLPSLQSASVRHCPEQTPSRALQTPAASRWQSFG
jgi:hypothetical protein